MDERLVITETGFLLEFLNQHSRRLDRPFCFILGSGVSRPSGIPTGRELAMLWLREMYESENFEGLPLDVWATAERLGFPGFSLDRLASFYPQLYLRRYGDHEQAGYAFLESQMEGKEPSFGYSVLAYLLSETAHKVVVTTNFDNLVADALSIHSSRFPLVVGHDALAQYAAVELRRPLVAKIHGALGFSPKSSPDETVALPEAWKVALSRIFERYTPIVLGYDGNDGSLMSFLQSLPDDIPDRVYWCVYAPDATTPSECLQSVSPSVCDYVRRRRGRFTPIRGFDQLMARILGKLREEGSVPDLYERLKERARKREQSYDDQQRRLFEAAVPTQHPITDPASASGLSETDSPLSQAVSEIADSRKEKPWWVWAREASNARDPDSKEAILGQALQALPESPDILRAYALFLEQDREDLDKAEEYYERALKADPKHARSLVFYGDFLERFRKDMDRAEEFYQRSLEEDPKGAYALTKYAQFLENVRKNMNKAEELYQRALEVEPNYAYNLRNYGQFLEAVRKDVDKAEALYQRALEVDPKNAFTLTTYARFLQAVRGDTQKAEELRQRARSVERS